MKYQVWIKEEFGELWKKVDCEDIDAAKVEIDKAVRTGGKPVLTQELHYIVLIELQEGKNEVTEGEAQLNQGAGVEGNGTV